MVKAATVLRSSSALTAELDRQSLLSPEELEALQSKRAAAHAKFAMEHTEFYREHYRAAGFTPADLDDPAAFSELPFVTKGDVRDHPEAFRSSEATPANSKRSVTGGSTGEPLSLLRDLRFPARALEWRLMQWWGVSPWDDVALVSRHTKSARETWRHQAQWWPSRRIQLNAFDMSARNVAEFMRLYERVRPRLVIGYVGAIAQLAAMLAEQSTREPAAPTALAVTAAPLNANQRVLVESVFRAPVYDHYRSAEVPWLAGECRQQDGLHVFADVRVVEVVDETGRRAPAGQTGEIVATDLTNRVFPLVRYRMGDRASYLDRPCACGVTLPLLSSVSGRTTEVLHLPNGQSLAGEGLAQIFSTIPEAVRQFQIRQRADYSIDLRVVPGGASNADRDITASTERFRELLNRAVEVRVQLVDSIPHDGGKTRYLLSEVGGRQ